MDGDGVNDIVVGDDYDGDGGTRSGAVYVTSLTADGVVKSAQKISNYYGNLPFSIGAGSCFGISVCSLGDTDGDGVNDISVGAYFLVLSCLVLSCLVLSCLVLS